MTTFECQECKRQGLVFIDDGRKNSKGIKKKQLVTHHIKEIKTHPELAWDEDNLETICWFHHESEHARYNYKIFKRNRFHEDEKW